MTFTGNVGNDYATVDTLGLFGAVGADLRNTSFTATYFIDMPGAWVTNTPNNGNYTSGINPLYNVGQPMVGAFTIGGTTVSGIGRSINGTNFTSGVGSQLLLVAQNGAGVGPAVDRIQVNTTTSAYPGVRFTQNGADAFHLALQFNFIGDQTIVGSNYFPTIFSNVQPNSGNGSFDFGGTLNGRTAQINVPLNPQSVSFALAPSAVPEPATWAMMLFGFAGLGGAMRYRTRRAASVNFA